MRIGLTALVLAVLVPSMVTTAPAQELSLSFSAGSFFASESAYRRIYGSSLPLTGDIWLKLKGPFGLAAGFSRLADKGIAVPIDGGEEEYPVEFRRTSIPLVVFYQVDVKEVALRFGAGIGIHRYREAWQTAELVFEGHKVSPRFLLAASVALLDRLSLLCTITYESINAGAGSPLADNVNLGGVQVLGGIAFRVF